MEAGERRLGKLTVVRRPQGGGGYHVAPPGDAVDAQDRQQAKKLALFGGLIAFLYPAFTIIEAESHEAAAKMFENHPHFMIFPGDHVETMEIMPIPGM